MDREIKKLTLFELQNKFVRNVFTDDLSNRLHRGEILFIKRNVQESGLYNVYKDRVQIATLKVDLEKLFYDERILKLLDVTLVEYKYKVIDLETDVYYYVTEDDVIEISPDHETNYLTKDEFVYLVHNELDINELIIFDSDGNDINLPALIEKSDKIKYA